MTVEFDYAKLRGKIKEIYGTQGRFAKAMEISSASLSAKLNNAVDFTGGEIDKARSLLLIDNKDIVDYFFARKVPLIGLSDTGEPFVQTDTQGVR